MALKFGGGGVSLRILDPHNPRDIAYFNAPVKPRVTPAFGASNWAMSSPAFVPERRDIWYSDGFGSFYVVRVTNGVWSPGRARAFGCHAACPNPA